ncbi:hypothetical protein [Salinirubrum litoreum]|uniref:DUF7967 domain-containing protein n=1 Tax=Salinirubrum litoreum TaxID=1126234 RepID=A0ABD5RCY6_9EURY|nr:hypothetical protein [Salinirubrum litoreum]
MSETVRCWLVERSYTSRDLIVLEYATEDGERVYRKELSAAVMHQQGTTVTAGVEVDPDDLAESDPEDRERYATEATRMAKEHDPDDEV